MSKISFRSAFSKDSKPENSSGKEKPSRSKDLKKKDTDILEEKRTGELSQDKIDLASNSKVEEGPSVKKSGRKSRTKGLENQDDVKGNEKEETQEEVLPVPELEEPRPGVVVPEPGLSGEIEQKKDLPVSEPSPPKPKETMKVPITSLFKMQYNPSPAQSSEPAPEDGEADSFDFSSSDSGASDTLTVSGSLGEQLSEYEDLESDQIITFFLGSEQYGLDILDAREVKQILPLTPIPRSPNWILGIVNLRGTVFPVVDLKKRINITSDITYPLNLRRIIIVEIEDTKIGLLVDKINMIFNKQTLEHSLPPALISGGEDFISFIAKKDENIISIISLTKLFTTEERELLAKIKEDKI